MAILFTEDVEGTPGILGVPVTVFWIFLLSPFFLFELIPKPQHTLNVI